MESFVAILELQITRLASTDTKFDDSPKITIMTGTVKNIDEFKTLVTLAGVTNETDYLWRQLYTFSLKNEGGCKKSEVRESSIGEWIIGPDLNI